MCIRDRPWAVRSAPDAGATASCRRSGDTRAENRSSNRSRRKAHTTSSPSVRRRRWCGSGPWPRRRRPALPASGCASTSERNAGELAGAGSLLGGSAWESNPPPPPQPAPDYGFEDRERHQPPSASRSILAPLGSSYGLGASGSAGVAAGSVGTTTAGIGAAGGVGSAAFFFSGFCGGSTGRGFRGNGPSSIAA